MFVFALYSRRRASLGHSYFTGLLCVACGPAHADLARLTRVLVLKLTEKGAMRICDNDYKYSVNNASI